MREWGGTPTILFGDPLRVACKHLKVGETIDDVCFVEVVAAVDLLAFE
jgi:hypothetical protein